MKLIYKALKTLRKKIDKNKQRHQRNTLKTHDTI
jgi:hypothetical protein